MLISRTEQQCMDCHQKVWSELYPYLTVSRNDHCHYDVLKQDIDLVRRFAQASTTRLPGNFAPRLAYIHIDFILLADGRTFVPLDMGGTHTYGIWAQHQEARNWFLDALVAELLAPIADNDSGHVFGFPYASRTCTTAHEKVPAAAALYHRLQAIGSEPRLLTPDKLPSFRPDAKASYVLIGAVEDIVPYLRPTEEGLRIVGLPFRTTYELLASRLSARYPSRYPKHPSQAADGYILQWPDLRKVFRASLVNLQYELLTNQWNLHLLARKGLSGFPDLLQPPLELARDQEQLEEILSRTEHRCIFLKTASSSRSAGIYHATREEARRPRYVSRRMRAQVGRDYGMVSQGSMYPITVSPCLPQQDKSVEGKYRERVYDFRIGVTYREEDRTLVAVPAFARRVVVPEVAGTCANKIMARLPRHLDRRIRHVPLANREALAEINLRVEQMEELARAAANVAREIILVDKRLDDG